MKCIYSKKCKRYDENSYTCNYTNGDYGEIKPGCYRLMEKEIENG